MQYSYTTLALAAFGSMTVFAAPTPYFSESSADVAVKRNIVSAVTSIPVVSTVATTAEPIVGSVAGETTSGLGKLPVVGGLTTSAVDKTASVVASVVKRFSDFVSPLAGTVTNDAGILVGIGKREVVGDIIPTALSSSPPKVEAATSSSSTLAKKDDSPLAVTDFPSSSPPVVEAAVSSSSTLVDSAESSSSTLDKKADSPVIVIIGAVDTLRDSVAVDLSTITTAVAADVLESIAPTIKTALLSIASSINTTILTIAPVVAGTVVPLAIDEVEALIAVLTEVRSIVEDIEAVLVSLVQEVVPDIFALIRPEISAVLAAIIPLVSPITSFAFVVAGTVSDPQGEGNAIRTAAFDVTGAATTLLSPVTGVVGSLVSR